MCRRQYANDVCNRGTAGKVAQSANSSHRTAMNKESPNANRNLLLDNPPNALLLDSNVDLLWHFPTLHHFDQRRYLSILTLLFSLATSSWQRTFKLILFGTICNGDVLLSIQFNVTRLSHTTLCRICFHLQFIFIFGHCTFYHQECCSCINQLDLHSRNPCKLYCTYLCNDNSPHSSSYQID